MGNPQAAAARDRLRAGDFGGGYTELQRVVEQVPDGGATGPAYLPVACDPESHRPVDLTEDECSHFGADVSFAGSAYLKRRRMLAKLTDCGLRLWGPDWTAASWIRRASSSSGRSCMAARQHAASSTPREQSLVLQPASARAPASTPAEAGSPKINRAALQEPHQASRNGKNCRR